MTEVCREYASALFELAYEQNAQEEYLEALKTIENTFEEQPEYLQLLSSPNIPFDERRELISQAFAAAVPEYVLSFTQLLCQKGHITKYGECVGEYEKLYRDMNARSAARIISAAPLTAEQKQELIRRLEQRSRHTVTAQFEVDEKLLGGVIIYMDDMVIDGSLRRRLKNVKEELGK